MVKFSRQLEAELIPEWKDAFVNYRQLKKNVKKIKLSRPVNNPLIQTSSSSASSGMPSAIRYLVSSFLLHRHHRRRHTSHLVEDDEEQFKMELVHSREHEVKHFFEKLENELEKVNRFYEAKEADFVERGEVLNKQLQILIDLKRILHDRRQRFRKDHRGNNLNSSSDIEDSVSNFSERATESEDPEAADDIVAALERNGVTFINSVRSKAKKGGKPKTTSMRIDIPPTNPTKTISTVTSMIWEDVVNSSKSPKKEGGDYITRKKIQCAEKIIRGAFIELYRGLGLLKTYNSLNMVAFRKILKKFDKVSGMQESGSYMRNVTRSHFASSDKVVRLGDEVEITFIKHFANNDRKKAMKFLRPQKPKESHTITFFVGLFTGSFVSLFIVYAILAHLVGIFSSSIVSDDANGGDVNYMETLYPIFSVFSLLSLHIFLYGCNLYAWRNTRINHNFIFEFSLNTALKNRDAFLISAVLMTIVVSAMVVHLLLLSTVISPHHVTSIPSVLLLIFTLLLFCPFNICYRSTRYRFLRVIRNIILSPFYRVLMVDFFMADQLTSQIPLMRHMEFTTCFFIAGGFGSNSYNICNNGRQFKLLSYIISFLPYYWRAMQCLRRYMEEGYDLNHIANAGKYISAMVSAAARIKYALCPTPFWLVVVVATSSGATMYQCYWDFVKDWGFFNRNSRNLFLRNELILKNKGIYYVSIIINFVLRLAWIQTIIGMNLGQVEHRLVEFLLASLEVIRRGHWNYYRLENEHLNNVGKFRAVKAVPLPFQEMDSDE